MVYPHILWTDERTDDLRRLIDSGFTSGQAATKLGISRNAVIGRCRRADPEIVLNGNPAVPSDRPLRLPRDAAPQPPHPRPQKPRPAPVAIVASVAAPPLAPAPAPPPAPTGPVPLIDLTNESCRWIDACEAPFLYCGTPEADFIGGVPYCRTHAKIAYRRPGQAA